MVGGVGKSLGMGLWVNAMSIYILWVQGAWDGLRRGPLWRFGYFTAFALGLNCMSDARDGVKEEGRMTFI